MCDVEEFVWDISAFVPGINVISPCFGGQTTIGYTAACTAGRWGWHLGDSFHSNTPWTIWFYRFQQKFLHSKTFVVTIPFLHFDIDQKYHIPKFFCISPLKPKSSRSSVSIPPNVKGCNHLLFYFDHRIIRLNRF